MEKNKTNTHYAKASPKSRKSKSTLSDVAAKLKGKELFPEKIEKAKTFFKNLKSLPYLRHFKYLAIKRFIKMNLFYFQYFSLH